MLHFQNLVCKYITLCFKKYSIEYCVTYIEYFVTNIEYLLQILNILLQILNICYKYWTFFRTFFTPPGHFLFQVAFSCCYNRKYETICYKKLKQTYAKKYVVCREPCLGRAFEPRPRHRSMRRSAKRSSPHQLRSSARVPQVSLRGQLTQVHRHTSWGALQGCPR